VLGFKFGVLKRFKYSLQISFKNEGNQQFRSPVCRQEFDTVAGSIPEGVRSKTTADVRSAKAEMAALMPVIVSWRKRYAKVL
jgi:hypothetical protein